MLAAVHPATGVLASPDGPVILDEEPRVRDVILALQRAVDRDCQPGRFVLTGSSANVLLLPRVAAALVGWMELLTLARRKRLQPSKLHA